MAAMSASWVRWPFDRWLAFWPDVEPELREERALGVVVPARPERGAVVERLPDGHPRIERHGVGHVGEPRLDRDLVARRIEAEDPRLAARRPQQVQQALDGRGLAGAVPAEEPVAAARLHAQVEAVDGVGAAVAADEIANLDDGVSGQSWVR